jgi:hypothetical protein
MNQTKATRRADHNDAEEMISLEQERRAGLTPAKRLTIRMDAAHIEPLGALDWNRRSDTISAAPDAP